MNFIFRMSQSPSDRPPAALTVTTSLAGLTSSWLNLALNADRLDEELASKSAESLFIRLCEQISRVPDPELPKEDLFDIQIHKRKETGFKNRSEKWAECPTLEIKGSGFSMLKIETIKSCIP